MKNQHLRSMARVFAKRMHGDQQHGSLPIIDHLDNVAANVLKHYDGRMQNICSREIIVASAYCHDLVEDTDVTPEEIESLFGEDVANIVEIVTDKSGKNRLERHLRTYHMIRSDPDALLVKLCDRRHNHDRSLMYNEKYLKMYSDEYLYFKFALYKPYQFVKLWQELDEQYEKMKWRVEND